MESSDLIVKDNRIIYLINLLRNDYMKKLRTVLKMRPPGSKEPIVIPETIKAKDPDYENPFEPDIKLPPFVTSLESPQRVLFWEVITNIFYTIFLIISPLTFAKTRDLPSISENLYKLVDTIFIIDMVVTLLTTHRIS